MKHKWTDAQYEFVKEKYKTHTQKELLELLNDHFDLNLKATQLKAFIQNNKIKSGRTGRFEPGIVPHNKGKSFCAPGSEKGWFKKGHITHNRAEVGAERINDDGYTIVKVAQPNEWKLKHRLIYEEIHGEVPKDHVIIFADRDKSNFNADNLIAVGKREFAIMNRNRAIKDIAEITKVNVNLAKIQLKISDLKKEG